MPPHWVTGSQWGLMWSSWVPIESPWGARRISMEIKSTETLAENLRKCARPPHPRLKKRASRSQTNVRFLVGGKSAYTILGVGVMGSGVSSCGVAYYPISTPYKHTPHTQPYEYAPHTPHTHTPAHAHPDPHHTQTAISLHNPAECKLALGRQTRMYYMLDISRCSHFSRV